MNNNKESGMRVALVGDLAFCSICQEEHYLLDLSSLDDFDLSDIEDVVFPKASNPDCGEAMVAKAAAYIKKLEERQDDDLI